MGACVGSHVCGTACRARARSSRINALWFWARCDARERTLCRRALTLTMSQGSAGIGVANAILDGMIHEGECSDCVDPGDW